MAKLYPPYIEGTIPAFCKDEEGAVTLTVPFSMNRAVNKSEVSGFQAVVKTVQSNNLVLNLSTTNYDIENNYEIYFSLTDDQVNELNIGQFYKVQVAYRDHSGTVGYYSTVGVVKYTTLPIVTIDPLLRYQINMHRYTYTGHYAQVAYEYTAVDKDVITQKYEANKYYILVDEHYDLCSDDVVVTTQTYYTRSMILDSSNANYKDTSEKEYSYQFILTNQSGTVVADSGTLLHNSSLDSEPYESSDIYAFPSDLDLNASYYIQYIVTTNNNMIVKSPKYRIMQKASIMPELDAEIVAELNSDNGYVKVCLVGDLQENGLETAATGAFLVTRSCSDDGFKVWNEVYRFVLHGQQPSRWLWTDYTIEQGKKYKYSLQQYNDAGLYSERLVSNTIEADFEDIFLYDGTRQLKIRYNPKVSSFKTDYLESKIETIGSKYPFIFRNGNVAYKEFPINGLISYQSDEENLFVNDDDLGLDSGFDDLERIGTLRDDITSEDDDFFNNLIITPPDYSEFNTMKEIYAARDESYEVINNNRKRTTDLTIYNVSAERLFKLKVLDWLNDGQPKLFRSPTEGNYIVRLMNVSMTPEDQLGRLLHSFSATAYEIADCTYENLNSFDIISITEPDNKQMRWETLALSTTEDQRGEHPDTRYTMFNDVFYLRGEILHGYHASATSVRFTDMQPGSIVYINVPEQLQNTTVSDLANYSYVIGATGTYMLEPADEITSIMFPMDAKYNGLVTFSYYSDEQNVFNTIENINIIEMPCRQFVGDHSDIIAELENVKNNFMNFYYLHFAIRYCDTAYWNDNILYRFSDFTSPITEAPTDERRTNLNGGRLGDEADYEDPLMLYKYTRDYLLASDNLTKVYGLTPYSNLITLHQATKYDVNITYYNDSYEIQTTGVNEENYTDYYCIDEAYEQLFERNNYFFLENGNVATTFNPEISQYYVIDPFVIYYDPYDTESLIMSAADIERFQAGLKAHNRTYVNTIKEYGTEIHINDHDLDLSDIEMYNIDHPISLDTVGQDCGIILECAYEIQELQYSIESSNAEVATAKSAYLVQKNYLTTAAMQAAEANDTMTEYLEKVKTARSTIGALYDAFIEILTEKIAEAETNE